MRKLILFLSVSLLFQIHVFGQCIIEAGDDRNICPEELYNDPKLYGVIISGDVTQLKWESVYYHASLDQYYYASIMLDDTTVMDPIIEQHFEPTTKFYLTGITANNETCTDSVTINISDWTFLTIDKVTGKHPNDTIQLWISAFSNWPHVKYEWSPNYMISDTTVEKPFVWNDTTTFYNLVITDSIGCSVTDDVFEVYSIISSIDNINQHDVSIYPNPTAQNIHVNSDQEIKRLSVYDLTGQLIKEQRSNEIDLSEFNSGQYLLQIEFENKEFVTRIIQKIK